MTFAEIVSSPYSFADECDIHSKWPFVYQIVRKSLAVLVKTVQHNQNYTSQRAFDNRR